MADSTDTSINVVASAGADVVVTEFLRAASGAMVFAYDEANSSALNWAWMGGRWNSISIPADDATLGASTTTYMVVAIATGVVTFATNTTNWNDTTNYWRAYKIVTNGSGVTSYEDHREKSGSGGGGGGSGDVVGPSASIANEVALFDGTTGKLIKRATSTGTPYLTSGVLSVNKVTLTQPATGSTLTVVDGKTLTASNSLTLAGTDATTMTFPPASASIGYLGIPQNSQSTAYTLVLADAGKHIYHPSADTTGRTWTIPANSSVAFPIGTAVTFDNDFGAGAISIQITTDTLVLVGTAGTTGTRTLASGGQATAIKVTSTRWRISGEGLS